jgi:acyl-CoA oxidase
MFWLTVQNLSSEEQKARWMPDIRELNIIGCYAQTELGHGSDVASLETTATLDKATDEFVIHSPTITSTKYWPGDLGRFSTHAVVHARLLIDGKFYGVQPFFV